VRRAAVHATNRLPRQWHAAADQTMQQPGAAEERILVAIYIDSKLLDLIREFYVQDRNVRS